MSNNYINRKKQLDGKLLEHKKVCIIVFVKFDQFLLLIFLYCLFQQDDQTANALSKQLKNKTERSEWELQEENKKNLKNMLT